MAIGALAMALGFACSSNPVTVTAATGAEGGACFPNNTCNAGLACLSNLCVRPAGPDGGSVDGGSDAESVDPAIEAAAAAYAKAYCDKAQACLAWNAGLADAPTCLARMKMWFIDQLTAPGSGWNAKAFTDCASQIANGSCADWFAGNSCVQRPGTLGLGAGCNHNSQCASFACLVQGDTCGKCVQQVQTGGTCITSAQCVGQDLCVSGKCVAYAAAGEACSSTQPCGWGLACRLGMCAQAGAGASCNLSSQDCQYGFFCSSVASSTCQHYEYGAPDGMCGFVMGDMSLWRDCAVGSCHIPGTAQTGTCPGAAADGKPCDVTNVCQFPAQCVGGVCKLPHASACK